MNSKILIVGSGAAGIAAATRLFRKGFRNLEILEANNRIGGRVHTVPFGATVVDLGGQWCHGEKNNVVYEMAGPLGLLEPSVVAAGNVIIRSNGELVPQELTDRLMEVAFGIMELEEIKTYQGTLGKFVTDRFREAMAEANNQDIDEELIQQFLVFFHNYQRGYIAMDSWNEMSAAGSVVDEECDGDQTLSWKGKGYKSILALLMNSHPVQTGEPIPIQDFIKFNKFVTNINWSNGPDGPPITVTCADESQHEATHIVVTTSIGVLKENHDSMFSPPLPSSKQNAIKGIHFGTVNKIIMEFTTPFWDDIGNTFGLLWNAQELEQLRGSPLAWTEGVSVFFKVDHQPNLLVAWIIGPEGRQAELLSDDQVIDGMMFLLKKFFKNKTIERPINMIRSKWSSDKHFRGSYSSVSLATEALKTGHNELAAPVLAESTGMPVLLFAGEATNGEHFGTVHGAIESGWREADRIIKYYRDQGCCEAL
ncbi:peroxisomal N(1)-acetyl-spermine/spermidine oxidase [Culex quinquefasciatus]|uniref:peroxisomal N(1)-acetyl-spermine/spermidine oxidase n=1 Tax=Culex quinquefasciatus TaxID=7176 RepID=UPI0018E320C3|nr:peroxisomal N(1)-acetyl-spermine/spermidine oxidase [Culex quinquefasciatus]